MTPDSEMIHLLEWESKVLTGKWLDQSLIFRWIRKYNQARQRLYKDKALSVIGVHVGLLQKSAAIAPTLNDEQRQRVLYFLRQFLKYAGVDAKVEG